MMLTWFFAGLCLHWAMTKQPCEILFVAQDEDRALIPLNYCKELCRNQDQELQAQFPLKPEQRYNRLDLIQGGRITALPGKDPDKLRGEHPTIVFFDEAADIEYFGESLDIAQAARPQKIVVISSAKPGAFREMTKAATVAPWPMRCPSG